VQHFVTRNKDLPPTVVPKKYYIHVMRLHNDIYRTTRQKVTVQVVDNYFRKMKPGEIMYYLDYDNRQLQKEKMNEENMIPSYQEAIAV
jgi:uncharacterized membrane-anchored protein YitT (DUF2179 family)